MGKIQVNALVNFPEGASSTSPRGVVERLLQYFVDRKELKLDLKDDSEPAAIINSLKDWLDSLDDDAITGLSGAESSTYEDREPPYPARNGPVQDLDELLLVKGITPELFYGRPEMPGISPYLTVHGATPGEGTGVTFPGRINIATAELPVLFALVPAENNDLVETLDELRRGHGIGQADGQPERPELVPDIRPGGSQLDPKVDRGLQRRFPRGVDRHAARRRPHHHRRGAAGAGPQGRQVDLPDPQLAGRLSRRRGIDIMSRKVLGLDIRSDSLCAVLVKGSLRESRIAASLTVPIATAGDEPGGLPAALEAVAAAMDLQNADCVVCVPASLFSCRNVFVPFGNAKKIRMVLPYELEPHLPYPADEMLVDFTILGGSEDRGETELLTVAVERQRLARSCRPCRRQDRAGTVTLSGFAAPHGSAATSSRIRPPSAWTSTRRPGRCSSSRRQVRLIRTFPLPADPAARGRAIRSHIRLTMGALQRFGSPKPPAAIFLTGSGIAT
jgi:hypothetical protein